LVPNTTDETAGFSHAVPNWDLAYASIDANFHSYATNRAHFDHPLLECQLEVAPTTICDLKISRVRRYHLKKLREKDPYNRLLNHYQNAAHYLEAWYWQRMADLPMLDLNQRRTIVEDFDRRILHHLQLAAEEALGSYAV
jgi:hypothetical protein